MPGRTGKRTNLRYMTKEKAYAIFYDYCHPIISRECQFYIKNREDREELEQNAFLRVCRKLHLYNKFPNITFRSWVKRLTKNICLRYLERRKTNLYLEDLIYQQPMVDSAESEKINKENQDEIMSAFQYLKGQRYEMMSLKYISNLKNAEIAEILGIPEGTVKSTIHRILKQIFKNNPNLCQTYKNY